jgi:hypothetical protein
MVMVTPEVEELGIATAINGRNMNGVIIGKTIGFPSPCHILVLWPGGRDRFKAQ